MEKKLNQALTPLFNPKELTYQHRVYMNGALFLAKGVKYKILRGTIMVENYQVHEAIEFMQVDNKKIFIMKEEEFFNKVKKENLKIK